MTVTETRYTAMRSTWVSPESGLQGVEGVQGV